MFFDSHAHLDGPRFDADRDAVLTAMAERGVTRMVNVGCDLASSRRSLALAEAHNGIYAAVGTHPSDADELDDPVDPHALRAAARVMAMTARARVCARFFIENSLRTAYRQWFSLPV